MIAPFPYFGGKRSIVDDVWRRLGTPKQYIEPFCGSAAMLLAAPVPAALEVVCDASGFIANFWRATKHQPNAVAEWADYPVSHVDLGARHVWLMGQVERIGAELQDCDWSGDAKETLAEIIQNHTFAQAAEIMGNTKNALVGAANRHLGGKRSIIDEPPLQSSRPVLLFPKPGMCLAIDGDVMAGTARWTCQEHVMPGESYCTTHRAKYYQKAAALA